MSEPVYLKKVDPDEPVHLPRSDAYLKIEMSADMGGQKLHFATVVDRDAPLSVLKNQLDRLSNAADWLGTKYSLRNLKIELEQYEKDHKRFQEDHTNWLAAQEDAWIKAGRRGEPKLHGNLQNTDSNFRNSIQQRRDAITKLRHQIAVAEAILKTANE